MSERVHTHTLYPEKSREKRQNTLKSCTTGGKNFSDEAGPVWSTPGPPLLLAGPPPWSSGPRLAQAWAAPAQRWGSRRHRRPPATTARRVPITALRPQGAPSPPGCLQGLGGLTCPQIGIKRCIFTSTIATLSTPAAAHQGHTPDRTGQHRSRCPCPSRGAPWPLLTAPAPWPSPRPAPGAHSERTSAAKPSIKDLFKLNTNTNLPLNSIFTVNKIVYSVPSHA